MADEADDDVLEHEDDLELDSVEDQPDDSNEGAAHEPADEDDGEPVFAGGEDQADDGNDLVRRLRREVRDRDREISTLRKSVQPEPEVIVGERPKIEDYDWDADRYEQALDDWDQRRVAKAEQDRKRDQAQAAQEAEWKNVTDAYAQKKAALRYPDKDQAERTAFAELSEVQQAVIAKVATDPALLVYALGKNPARLSKLAAIDNPLELAAEIGRMGAQMTTKKRNPAPEPDRPERGGAPKLGGDKKMEQLEKEADRTGDRSKVIAYKAAQRAKENRK